MLSGPIMMINLKFGKNWLKNMSLDLKRLILFNPDNSNCMQIRNREKTQDDRRKLQNQHAYFSQSTEKLKSVKNMFKIVPPCHIYALISKCVYKKNWSLLKNNTQLFKKVVSFIQKLFISYLQKT